MQITASITTLLIILLLPQRVLSAQYGTLLWSYNVQQILPVSDGNTLHEVSSKSLKFAKSIKGQSPEFNDSNCKLGRCIRLARRLKSSSK